MKNCFTIETTQNTLSFVHMPNDLVNLICTNDLDPRRKNLSKIDYESIRHMEDEDGCVAISKIDSTKFLAILEIEKLTVGADVAFLDKMIAFLKPLDEKQDTFSLIEDSRGFHLIPSSDISETTAFQAAAENNLGMDVIDADHQKPGM